MNFYVIKEYALNKSGQDIVNIFNVTNDEGVAERFCKAMNSGRPYSSFYEYEEFDGKVPDFD